LRKQFFFKKEPKNFCYVQLSHNVCRRDTQRKTGGVTQRAKVFYLFFSKKKYFLFFVGVAVFGEIVAMAAGSAYWRKYSPRL
jgi:hypothetical protein